MADVVTDPDLLKRLQAAAAQQTDTAAPAAGPVVTDPALLERLRVAAKEQAPPERSIFGQAASFLGAPDPNAAPDPYGANATIGRIATGVIGGIPDLAIKLQNAGLTPSAAVRRLFGAPQQEPIPEITPMLRQATGTPELPPEASGVRRFGEAAGTVLASGGSGIIGRAIAAAPSATAAILPAIGATARGVVAPIVGSEVGGNVGGYVGGEKGALLGSILGGLVGNVPGPSSMIERYYGGQARPDAPQIAAAAARQNVTPSAGMLGNENVQARERTLAGRGTGPFTNPVVAARERTLVQMREAADQAAVARGSTEPSPTPGTIGQSIIETADQARQNLRQQSSTAQQGMMDRVGVNAPVDVAPVYAALRAQIAKTDPITARPLQTRLDALEQMMPRDKFGQPVVGQAGDINVPYGVFKDWRSGLGRSTQTLEAVPAGHLDQIYGAATDAMRKTATAEGVSPAEFDMTQGITRALTGSGGPVPYFEKVAGTEGTSGGRVGGMTPEAAFTHVVKQGEQNPQRLQPFEQHAEPGAVSQIAGDVLRQRSQATLGAGGTGGTGAPIEGVRGGGAAGTRNFANWWANMSPEAKRILGGNVAPTMEDLSQLAGAFNYPTRQTGLSRALEGQSGGLASRFFVAEGLSHAAHAMGLPRAVGYAAGLYGLMPALHYIQSAILESNAARRGLTGNFTASAPPSLADLISQLTAANVARSP